MNVEEYVKQVLDQPDAQWKSSWNPTEPFVVEDESYHYLSGRWPGDAQKLAERCGAVVSGVEEELNLAALDGSL